ncbi:hypothetical protein DRP77_08130 [Candidatus Poribacteria bacterium]|nr:MAG: hypothetical protein DRP77_08130 [Candidatus Poribacteria bacterium]
MIVVLLSDWGMGSYRRLMGKVYFRWAGLNGVQKTALRVEPVRPLDLPDLLAGDLHPAVLCGPPLKNPQPSGWGLGSW